MSDPASAAAAGWVVRHAIGSVLPRAMSTPSGRDAIGCTSTCTTDGTASAAASSISTWRNLMG